MQSLLSHPSLMDCRRLFLRNYEVFINIGVHAFEKTGEQRVLINVDLYIPLALSTPQADEFDAAFRMTPLERASTPDDIARAVRFLIESPAITGTTLLVDGGQHLRAQPRDVMFLARHHLETKA